MKAWPSQWSAPPWQWCIPLPDGTAAHVYSSVYWKRTLIPFPSLQCVEWTAVYIHVIPLPSTCACRWASANTIYTSLYLWMDYKGCSIWCVHTVAATLMLMPSLLIEIPPHAQPSHCLKSKSIPREYSTWTQLQLHVCTCHTCSCLFVATRSWLKVCGLKGRVYTHWKQAMCIQCMQTLHM